MKKFTALFTALALLLCLCACSSKVEKSTWQEQFDLGVRYLSEGNYEEAILTFTAAIEIDPMQAETYERLADAYLALGDLEMALQTLRDGYVATEDAKLKTRIDELFMLESIPTSELTPEPNPTQPPESMQDNASTNISWHYDDGTRTLTISGTGRMEDYDYGDYYRPWGLYNDSIESIEILNGVTSIGDCAFRECYGVSNVSIPSSVTSIGEFAFGSCDNLTNITIPLGVTSIGKYAFFECSGLTSIERTMFFQCSSLTNISIPNGVTSIGEEAFAYCDSLISITIPNSVTVIEASAFNDCSSLTDIYYDANLEQWDAIINHPYGFSDALLSATIHFNS